jgi:hypothetical protein
MANINFLKDKNDNNCFIIYFYFTLPLYLLFLSAVWLYASNYHFVKGYYELVWQFDEILYAYLIWPFFSLLNLSYITIKNNKIKLYFLSSLIIFISLISTHFIFSIENIYKLNFPEQFLSLYLNSIIFVIAVISSFILFSIILFRNGFNKHNFILLNSYFFLIILLIAILFVIINKPKSLLASEYFLPSILGNLVHSFYFLFIPFLTFLFFILIYFFKNQIIPYIVITALAFWDYFISYFRGLFMYPVSVGDIIFSFIFIFLPLIIWTQLYFKGKSYSLLQKGVLFNIIMLVFYSAFLLNFTVGTFYYPYPPPPVIYKPEPVYGLSSSIVIIILFLIFVNMVIYLRARLTLKTLK